MAGFVKGDVVVLPFPFADLDIILYRAGRINRQKIDAAIEKLMALFQA